MDAETGHAVYLSSHGDVESAATANNADLEAGHLLAPRNALAF